MVKFSDQEREIIFSLAQKIVGLTSDFRADYILQNFYDRMRECKISNLVDYLSFVRSHPQELSVLVSNLTIHTTHWFRDPEAFYSLEKVLCQDLAQGKCPQPFLLLSAGCSTGQETYTIASILEGVRLRFPQFEYRVVGIDVDPLSVQKAKKGIYTGSLHSLIPKPYLPHFVTKSHGFQIKPEVRERIEFCVANLLQLSDAKLSKFHAIFCRNVLIYFDKTNVMKVLEDFNTHLHSGGFLSLGANEYPSFVNFNWVRCAPHLYKKQDFTLPPVASESGVIGSRQKLILIGASTGGPAALAELLKEIPKPSPPILIIQHIDPDFSHHLADQLASSAHLKRGLIRHGEPLTQSTLYFSTEPKHILLRQSKPNDVVRISLWDGPLVQNVKPSIDVTFESAASLQGIKVCACLLTGMGEDGARGLLMLRKRGAFTLAQDEFSCAVYGMPKKAAALGAATKVCPPQIMRQHVLVFFNT